ncbi:hypothetical protein [Hymenobacter sp. 102]|uniref:hypothetical protein n=1 Tax=Hymenobacter sp. 102 TaxID=3403152 RepID=UPI003CF4E108
MNKEVAFWGLYLMQACVIKQSSHQPVDGPYEITFATRHYDYGWKYYDRDSVKFSRPMRYVVGSYPIVYRLNTQELVIYTTPQGPDARPEVAFRQQHDKRTAARLFASFKQVNLDSLVRQTDDMFSDDGFSIDESVTKEGQNRRFRWSNVYLPSLFQLLSTTNHLSPERLKIYSDAEESNIIRQLQQASPRPH